MRGRRRRQLNVRNPIRPGLVLDALQNAIGRSFVELNPHDRIPHCVSVLSVQDNYVDLLPKNFSCGQQQAAPNQSMDCPVHLRYPKSIKTSPFSTLMGYVFNFSSGWPSAAPVFGSHRQPCQGQTTLLSSTVPCPSEPP